MKKPLLIIFYMLCLMLPGLAQTGGPGQPEFMQFKPVTASNLVNLSTGSFSYNIPLFTIGGYPLNMSYQSGPQMQDVASYLGLGWSLDIGAVNRNIRGLPDDFNGDVVKRTIYMKPNITMGGDFNLGLEVGGFPVGASAGWGVFYNNYNGFGVERSYGVNFSISNASQSAGGSLGLGMKANSQNGVDIYAQPSVFLSSSKTTGMSAHGSLGGDISVNSREGLKGSVNASMSVTVNINQPPPQADEKENSTAGSGSGEPKALNFAAFAATYSFSKSPEIPRVSYPFTTTSYTGNIKAGGELFFLHPNGAISGYYTRQALSTNTINTPAYGFLYSDKSLQAGSNVLLDYNREKDQPYVKDVSQNIGIPFYTNDIYSVNAQGIGGSFQLNRGDIGVISDNKVTSSSSSLNIGLEAGIGDAFHVGADISSTSVSSSSGKWTTGTTHNLDFKATQLSRAYQSAWFKNASDVSVDENNFYGLLDGDKAIKAGLHKTGITTVDMDNRLYNRDGTQLPASTAAYKAAREPLTVDIQYLTAAETTTSGLDKQIYQYTVNQFDCKAANYKTQVQRVGDFRQRDHISQITATNVDGMRYVFGLPTYNISQEEVSYTLTGNETVDQNGLVNYLASTVWGTNGKDGFYEKTETPAYITSNLLTAVLSPDYIDVDDNGPSVNDVGNYVKFNYCNAGIYTWRTPDYGSKSTFNKAFLSDPADNKASYVQGTKEVWYIHSIESKTEVAEFFYDTDRQDARDINGKQLYRLNTIKVYSKNELVLAGADATPIRVIQFTQDYELCPNTTNSTASPSHGKLTLKKVGMYSGKSMRELQSPYQFTYGAMPSGTVINPSYNTHQVNRWGNYQENPQLDITASNTANVTAPGPLSNGDFPYASQDTALMGKAAYAWNLSKIQLPGGGTVQPIYEPHHYAYTQDQRNMEMFLIEGFGSTPGSATGPALYTPSSHYNPSASNNFVRIKLNKSLPPGTATEQYQQLLYRYFNVTAMPAGGLPQYFYYKTLIQLRADRETTWEWVTGYCQIKSVGLIDTNHAYIELKPVCINDESDNTCTDVINPIAKNAFQFIRLNRPGLGYGNSEAQPLADNVTLEDFLHMPNLSSTVNAQTTAFFHGFNKFAREGNYANNVALDKSFFRLYSPDQDKLIGGSRVKTVITSDTWDQLTAGYSAPQAAAKTYTTDYVYTDVVKNPVTNQDQVISSGVTEYEPQVGGDENPLHQPLFYNQQIKLAPDNNLYVEMPYNESLFPAANLIYSKVKVIANKTTLPVPGSGYQVHEFFTAKDYPVKTDNTSIGDNFEAKTSVLQGLTTSILGVSMFHDYVTVSQGFAIVRNDMHGKTKATKNYNSQGALVSAEEYEYGLNKNLQLMRRDGTVYMSDKLGVSVSAICDSRAIEHNTVLTGVDMNLDFTVFAIIPSVMFMPFPKYTNETTKLNSVAFNKIVDKKGIVTKKTVTENGAAIATENLVFDEKTGLTLITKTTNEFNDPLYAFHYPAHWIYPGLSAGYQSNRISFPVTVSNQVSIANDTVFNALNKGDELADAAGNRLWVMAKGFNTISVQPKVFNTPPVPGNYMVLRPGRHNLINDDAGTITTNFYPVQGGKLNFTGIADSLGIINAGVRQYADDRVKTCNCDLKGQTTGGPVVPNNPYFTGELGSWYPLKTWAYLTDRSRSTHMPDNLTNLRKDGLFKTFTSFYKPPANVNKPWLYNPTNWQWVETVTIKDVNGISLETKDVLNRYNATLTGYQQKLVSAQVANAQNREILFDGFEDWNYQAYDNACDKTGICIPDRIKWNGIFELTPAFSHSGTSSGQLLVPSVVVTVSLDHVNVCNIPPTVAGPDDRKLMVATVPQRIPDSNAEDATVRSVCCTGIFVPVKGKKYIISAWVHEEGNTLAYTFTAPSIMADNITFTPSGNIIDGWQRISGEFTIPATATTLNIKFGKGANPTYFDDIRIYPADAKMTTYVYDRNTQKLTFSSDENNYFTKYNYDGESNLQSINKETEQGVQTVKEARSATHKN